MTKGTKRRMKNSKGVSNIEPGAYFQIGSDPFQLLQETAVGLHVHSLSLDEFGERFFFPWDGIAYLKLMTREEGEDQVYEHLSRIAFKTEEIYLRQPKKRGKHPFYYHRFILTTVEARRCHDMAGDSILARLLTNSETFNGRWPSWDYRWRESSWTHPCHLKPDLRDYQDKTRPQAVLRIMRLIQDSNVLRTMAAEAKHPIVREAAGHLLAKRSVP